MTTRRTILALTCAALAGAQAPMLSFTASTANVAGAPEPVRIDLFRWSSDAEREQLMDAWNMTGRSGRAGAGQGKAAPADQGKGAAKGGGRGGRGGRGPASDDDPAPDPAAEVGGSRRPVAAVPTTPEGSLLLALQRAGAVGYLWTSGVAGHAIRYAAKLPQPDGTDRIILITDRRLGKYNNRWIPKAGEMPATPDFSIIELRVNAKGEGEGKASLTGKLAVDNTAKILAIENYSALPAALVNVKQRTVASH
jgi:hypothetical protein